MYVVETFSEWISHSFHFTVILLRLAEGWHWAVATSERCQQRSRVKFQDCPMHNLISSELDSALQLVGSTPTSMARLGQTKETGAGCTPRAPISQPRGRPLRDAPQRMVPRIHLHLPQTEEGPTQTGTLQQVRHLALAATEEGSVVRSDSHLHTWICQFSSQPTQMQM